LLYLDPVRAALSRSLDRQLKARAERLTALERQRNLPPKSDPRRMQ
jgi:hypothetical protein